MAKKLLTVDEAARLLSVSPRTLRTYVRQGFLAVSKQPGGNRHYFDPEDVETFRREKSEVSGRTVISRREHLQVQSRLRRVEASLAVVLRLLDAKDNPLRMGPAYAKELHSACVGQLKMSGWKPTEIEPWVEIFLRIDEEDFQAISEATEDSRPWKPFLQLCLSMSAYLATHENYGTSLDLQDLHRTLTEGRRRMRISALCYSDMYGTQLDADLRRYALADSPASVRDTLARILKTPIK